MSDAELLDAIRSGQDQAPIGELFARHGRLLLGVCMKYLRDEEESKDAVMDIFMTLGDKIRRHEVTHLKSWLYILAKNHCLMQMRKRKEVRTTSDPENNPSLMELPEVLHPNEKGELEKKLTNLEAALKQLKPEHEKCIRLFYLEKKSYQEVADATGFDLKQVKSYIQNGKRNLAILLGTGP